MNKTVFYGLLALLLTFGFVGCDNGSNGDSFTSSTNETISNDVVTLGLVGTSVTSSNTNVATADIVSGKIKITSVSDGSVVITVSESTKNATISIIVSKTGSITIETITKYVALSQNPFKGSWSGTIAEGPLAGQNITFVIEDAIWQYILSSNYGQKGTYTYDGNNATMEITHLTSDGTTWLPDLSELPYTTFSATLSNNILDANGTNLTKVIP